MDLKDFKAGVETLARFTNQREAEPDPFMVQVGKDGMISLIAGDDTGLVVWRTGISGGTARKAGIKSKTLVQAAKVLKGRGVTVTLECTDTALLVKTSNGGSITLPYGERPNLMIRPMVGDYTEFAWTADEFEVFIKCLDASCAKGWPDGLVVEPANVGFHRFSSTDSYKIWQAKKASSNGVSIPEPVAVRASFWNALRGSKTDAVTRFYSTGVRTLLGPFEFSTGFLADHPIWPDMKAKYYDGKTSDVRAVFDRKQLIGAIKAVQPATKAEATSIAMAYSHESDKASEASVQSIASSESVGVKASKGKGSGRIECSGTFMLEILNAIPDKEVIVEWQHPRNLPLLVTGTASQWSSFCLAPVIRI